MHCKHTVIVQYCDKCGVWSQKSVIGVCQSNCDGEGFIGLQNVVPKDGNRLAHTLSTKGGGRYGESLVDHGVEVTCICTCNDTYQSQSVIILYRIGEKLSLGMCSTPRYVSMECSEQTCANRNAYLPFLQWW